MIDGNQVRFADKVHGNPESGSAVYKGSYTPFNADGGQDQFTVAIKKLSLQENNPVIMKNVMQEVIIQSKLEGCQYICKCSAAFQETRRSSS